MLNQADNIFLLVVLLFQIYICSKYRTFSFKSLLYIFLKFEIIISRQSNNCDITFSATSHKTYTCYVIMILYQYTFFPMINPVLFQSLSIANQGIWKKLLRSEAAIGSCSYEKVFLNISSPGNQSYSEYILVLFLLGNWDVSANLMLN